MGPEQHSMNLTAGMKLGELPLNDMYTVSNDDDDSDDDDEEEEPLIIHLMESMFTSKKTVQESQQMISEISLEQIRQEIRASGLAEKVRVANLERAKKFERRIKACERLNELL